MLLRALRPWFNQDHEGHVEPGQTFEASEYRARELTRAGLAMIAATQEKRKIHVPSDPPQQKKKARRDGVT